MTLVILDPNLEGEAGHHLGYDMVIAREAMARGEAATIIANRRFPAKTIDGVRILPHFTESCYATLHTDPVTGRFDDFRHFNDLLQAELAALPRGEFRPSDAVLVPTVTEIHLAGYVGWMKGFDPLEAPLFLIHLMLPSGVTLDGEGGLDVEDEQRALFYRLAARAAAEPGPPIHLFASGGQHAAEYGALFGQKVPPHPVPIRPIPPAREAPLPRRALLFAGDAKLDKGVALLPELMPRLAATHPDWTFAAHVNTNAAWGEAKDAGEAVLALAPLHDNLDIAGGRLSPADYQALTGEVRIALFPYDPVLYRRKSSGVLWEAISRGTPVVVPAGTWLENEARHWGAGHVSYATPGADAIAEAFDRALPRIAELTEASAAAAQRYRTANGAAALMDQIAALWVSHQAASSLVTRPRSAALDFTRFEAGWHLSETVQGRPMRWTGLEPELAFDWPFEEGWEMEISLSSFFGDEQLEKAEVVADTPVGISWSRSGRGARLLLQGPGPGRAAPRIGLRLRLPYTYRPANEVRELGVLVSGIRLGPLSGAAAGAPLPALGAATARVLTRGDAATGWPLAPAVSGDLLSPDLAGGVLAFRLSGGSVPALRRATLFVNGANLPLGLSAEADGQWLATATIAPALLRRQPMPASWDLLAEATEGPPILLRAVGFSALAGNARPLTDETATEAPDAAPEPEPDPPAPDDSEPRIRWDLATGIGPEEGPFPEIGVPAGVRWVTARQARLTIEAPEALETSLVLAYRSLLPRQGIRVAVNGGEPTLIETTVGRLQDSAELSLDLALREGANEITFAFTGAVREPGSGRELVLLIETLSLARHLAAAQQET